MRRTQKYVAALPVAATLLRGAELRRVSMNHAALYEVLERSGWWWDSSAGSWSNERRSTSIFEGDDGLPSGVLRLRVMANPSEVDDVIDRITRSLLSVDLRVFEVSERYPNRRGPGVRVYLSVVREESLPEDRSGFEPMIGG
jgi:hypothetical protein